MKSNRDRRVPTIFTDASCPRYTAVAARGHSGPVNGGSPPFGYGQYRKEGGVMKPGKKIVRTVASVAAAVLFLGGVAHAEGFLLGEEGKGVTVKAAENTDLNVRIRLQPRFDAGDLIKSDEATPTSYESETDFYLRRIRLELGGHIVKNLTYNLTFEGDKNSKAPGKASNEVKILYAYGNYKFADPLSVRFGKAKLPYSRVSITSSSKH